jgi:hypothetical protein
MKVVKACVEVAPTAENKKLLTRMEKGEVKEDNMAELQDAVAKGDAQKAEELAKRIKGEKLTQKR